MVNSLLIGSSVLFIYLDLIVHVEELLMKQFLLFKFSVVSRFKNCIDLTDSKLAVFSCQHLPKICLILENL